MTDMNLNKLPCVNTINLNKYLAEQEHEDNYQSALTEKTTELEKRELTGEDFEESLHRLTGRSHVESLEAITAQVMVWIADESDHNAQIVCSMFKGSMLASRFLDSLEKAQAELAK